VADLPESSTTPKQLKPSATTTTGLRLHVQVQLSKPACNIVEEGIRGIPPSSSEISLPAKQQPPNTQTVRLWHFNSRLAPNN